jgi:hypothetical protein
MGVLDLFKRKKRETASNPEEAGPAHGWDAITNAFEAIYPGRTNPVHRAPLVNRMHDLSENAEAFDGVSAYEADGFWHFVTYGLTELYGKENEDSLVSGFGYELTFRLPKTSGSPPPWAFDFLEAIGKQVWNGATFAAGHTIKTGPLDGRPDTRETAVLVVRDPSFAEPLETPNGQVDLLLLLGVDDDYRNRVLAAYEASGGEGGWEASIVDELREQNPDLVTPIRTAGEWGEQ